MPTRRRALSLALRLRGATGPKRRMLLAASAASLGRGYRRDALRAMLAVHASAHLKHNPLLVGLSVAIAIGASALALMLLGGGWSRAPLRASAIAMGLAISGMHYTAMAGTTVYPHPASAPPSAALSPDLLAIVVAIVAFLVSGSFLLSMMPDQGTEPQAAPQVPAELQPLAATQRRVAPLPFERDGAQYLLPVTDLLADAVRAVFAPFVSRSPRSVRAGLKLLPPASP